MKRITSNDLRHKQLQKKARIDCGRTDGYIGHPSTNPATVVSAERHQSPVINLISDDESDNDAKPRDKHAPFSCGSNQRQGPKITPGKPSCPSIPILASKQHASRTQTGLSHARATQVIAVQPSSAATLPYPLFAPVSSTIEREFDKISKCPPETSSGIGPCPIPSSRQCADDARPSTVSARPLFEEYEAEGDDGSFTELFGQQGEPATTAKHIDDYDRTRNQVGKEPDETGPQYDRTSMLRTPSLGQPAINILKASKASQITAKPCADRVLQTKVTTQLPGTAKGCNLGASILTDKSQLPASSITSRLAYGEGEVHTPKRATSSHDTKSCSMTAGETAEPTARDYHHTTTIKEKSSLTDLCGLIEADRRLMIDVAPSHTKSQHNGPSLHQVKPPDTAFSQKAFVSQTEDCESLFVPSHSSYEATHGQNNREQRILQMQKRNERNRKSDAADQDDIEDDIRFPYLPITSMLGKNTSPGRTSNYQSEVPIPPVTAATRRRTKDRKLGPIHFADILCVTVRESKANWADVASIYNTQSGEIRSLSTVRGRIIKVRKALERAEVTAGLLEAALREETEALEEINKIVADRVGDSLDWTLDGEPSGKDNDVPFAHPKVTHLARSRKIADKKPVPSPIRREDPTTTQRLSSAKTNDGIAVAEVQHTVSGKQPCWELLQTYWAARHDDEADETSECTDREVDELLDTYEDYVHYAYQVQRRECRNASYQEDDLIIEEVEWHDVGETYTSLKEANAAACGRALLLKIGVSPIVDGSQRYTIRKDADDTGCTTCEYSSENGTVQTRVVRRLRTFQDQTLVYDKAEWHPRTVYHVKQRTTTTSFTHQQQGTVKRFEAVESLVDGETCADVAWSNARAVEHFVASTYENRSANLNIRDLEIAELKRSLMEELEAGGDGVLFMAEKTTSKGKVQVWVEQGKLVGPRNL